MTSASAMNAFPTNRAIYPSATLPGSLPAGGQSVTMDLHMNRAGHRPSSPSYRQLHHILERPLTTHTLLGSPINSRTRSQSMGSAPVGWSASSTHHHSLQNGSLPTLESTQMPPEPSVTQKAMEAAAAAERDRARKLEDEEVDLSADDLRHRLRQERHRTARFAADLAALKQSSVQSQLEAEVIEEGRINGLMRRLDILQQEKGRIIVELEREEELLTNTLQKREKAVLEKQIKHEKTVDLALQKQLSDIRNEHLHAAETLEEEDEIEMEE